jgi:hypothetical protein
MNNTVRAMTLMVTLLVAGCSVTPPPPPPTPPLICRLSSVHPGMSYAEMVSLVGEPASQVKGARWYWFIPGLQAGWAECHYKGEGRINVRWGMSGNKWVERVECDSTERGFARD